MKLHYRLWFTFFLLFILVGSIIYFFIQSLYKERVLSNQAEVMYSQGHAVIEQVRSTYPRFNERLEGYIQYYSEQLKTRLFLLQQSGEVMIDSSKQFSAGTQLSLHILKRMNETEPVVQFIPVSSYGYVQYTLMPIQSIQLEPIYLLMIKDVNYIYDDIQSFNRQVVMLLAIAMVSIFIVCFFVSTWFTKPFRVMITKMREISPQQRAFQVSYKRKDEIKELIDEISFMVNQLSLYDARQRQFMSTASHELKTPLATIQLIAENLPFVREQEAEYQEFVSDLHLQIRKMKQVIERLLDVNRMWEREVHLQIIEGEQIEAYVRKQYEWYAAQKNITIHFKVKGHKITADFELLKTLIDNLISNAIRYSPADKTIRIAISRSSFGETLLQIQDEGIGIDESEIPFLFEPFYRSQEATEWDQEGSGLGLTIVKQIADLHGAQVFVESTILVGTKFTIAFRNKSVTK